jgi:hypothetical protein
VWSRVGTRALSAIRTVSGPRFSGWCKRQQRAEPVDNPVHRGGLDPKQRLQLPHCKVRPVVRRDRQHPVAPRQGPVPALAFPPRRSPAPPAAGTSAAAGPEARSALGATRSTCNMPRMITSDPADLGLHFSESQPRSWPRRPGILTLLRDAPPWAAGTLRPGCSGCSSGVSAGVRRRTEAQVRASVDGGGPRFFALLMRLGAQTPSRVRIPEPPPGR